MKVFEDSERISIWLARSKTKIILSVSSAISFFRRLSESDGI